MAMLFGTAHRYDLINKGFHSLKNMKGMSRFSKVKSGLEPVQVTKIYFISEELYHGLLFLKPI